MKRTTIIILFTLILSPIFSYELEGLASWYGGKFQGRQTASGEIFDTYEFTAAHKELPFGTIVEVKNNDNGKVVNVRINDRGPFIEGRVIDLSYVAALELDIIKDGVASVTITILEHQENNEFYRIQVGAYGSIENGLAMKRLLEDIGLTPSAELTNSGLTRIFINNVPSALKEETLLSLREIGINSPLVRLID